MTMREQVLQEALALPPEDRAFVVERLDQSLHQGEFVSPEIAAAWTAEIDRRIDAYERGQMLGSNADEAMARMRRILADHRTRKLNS